MLKFRSLPVIALLTLGLAACGTGPGQTPVASTTAAFTYEFKADTELQSLSTAPQQLSAEAPVELATKPLVKIKFSNGKEYHYANRSGWATRDGDVLIAPSKEMPKMAVAYEKYVREQANKMTGQGLGLIPYSYCSFYLFGCWSYGTVNPYWPNGRIPYQFDPSASPTLRAAFVRTRDAWNAAVGKPKFEPAADSDYVTRCTGPLDDRTCNVIYGGITVKEQDLGNNSSGRAGLGYNSDRTLIIDDNYTNDDGVITHEMGHIAGLLHEHQRCDRDLFVHVYPPSSAPVGSDAYNTDWAPRCDAQVAIFGPFDYDSVMIHNYGYSIDSIIPPAGSYQGDPYRYPVGNNGSLRQAPNVLSGGDKTTLYNMYLP